MADIFIFRLGILRTTAFELSTDNSLRLDLGDIEGSSPTGALTLRGFLLELMILSKLFTEVLG